MRCPKCGYISFDRQRSCGKCSNDLTAVAEQITGTVGKAAAPFFLGAVLGTKNASHDEPGPVLYEEEESLALDELDVATLPTAEEMLDFAETPLNEEDEENLEEQPLASLGLEDIDVSDLIPATEEKEEELELPLTSEDEETRLVQDEEEGEEVEASLEGIDLPSLEPEDLFSADETESPLGGSADEAAEAPAKADEEEEIIDLSSLMSFDDTPTPPTEAEEDHEVLDLSFDDAPEELHLSLEDGESAPAPAEEAKKPASTLPDIPDLGLTLENDDE